MTQGTMTKPSAGPIAPGLDRRILTLSLGAITVAAALSGFGIAAMATLILAVASAFSGRRSFVSAIPPAAVVVGFAWVAALQLAAVLNLAVLSSPWGARAAMAGFGLLASVLGLRRPVRVGIASRSEVWAVLPAIGLAAGALVISRLPAEIGTVWFGGGIDNVNHTLNAVVRQQQGSLDYSSTSRPGGWHAVLALMITASSDSATPSVETLVPVLQVSGQAVWLLYVLVVAAVGLLAHDWAIGLPRPNQHAAWAGAGAAATTVGPAFFVFTMYFGFQTFIAAALGIAVLLREGSLKDPGWAWSMVVASASVGWVAHAWPPSLAYVAIPWIAVLVRTLRTARSRHQRELWIAGLATAIAAVSVQDVLLTLVRRTDVAATVDVGEAPIADFPMSWFWVGATALALLSVLRRTPVPLLTVVPGLVASVALALQAGTDVLSYYPRKLLWITALMGVAAIWAVAANLLSLIVSKAGRPLAFFAAASVPIATVLAIAFLAPLLMIYAPDRWEQWRDTLRVATDPLASQADVVWDVADTDEGDVFLLRIMDYYRMERPKTQWPLRVLTVQEQCAILAAAEDPAVLTSRQPSEVHARYTCVANVRTIPAAP